ncbi:uncharacterized protein LOC133196164 [Saccostrea echinata]|uniref:uncharacterized protein LOC133196164 n=1 Tax=Saccostrea echinata TaxID=191078 RepID=UPI002A834EBE|nr:uncharacterized protein LOC133196164 [Saccostrea echinata]
MLKAEEVLTPKLLTDIWQTETAPDNWKVGLIVKLPKKGDLADSNNWRGMMLLSVTSKVLSRVILNRMASMVDPYLCEENKLDSEMENHVQPDICLEIFTHYGIPNEIISIIQMLYKYFQAQVICGTELTESFPIQKGSLKDLDFVDDIALLAEQHKDIQGKTDGLVRIGRQIGLNINVNKTNKITANGDTTKDAENRIAKARATFANLQNIWKSSNSIIRTKTKIRIFKTNIIGVLKRSDSWKVTNNITQKLDIFQQDASVEYSRYSGRTRSAMRRCMKEQK